MSTKITSGSMKKKRLRVDHHDSTELDINIQTPKRKSQRFVRLEDLTICMPTQNKDFATIGMTNSDSGTLVHCQDDGDDILKVIQIQLIHSTLMKITMTKQEMILFLILILIKFVMMMLDQVLMWFQQ